MLNIILFSQQSREYETLQAMLPILDAMGEGLWGAKATILVVYNHAASSLHTFNVCICWYS